MSPMVMRDRYSNYECGTGTARSPVPSLVKPGASSKILVERAPFRRRDSLPELNPLSSSGINVSTATFDWSPTSPSRNADSPSRKSSLPLQTGNASRISPSSSTWLISRDFLESRPRSPPLPEGWTEHATEDGHVYYYNDLTDQTQWERPCLNTVLIKSRR